MIPQTLNGHSVIAALPRVTGAMLKSKGSINVGHQLVVLVHRPDDDHPFVTADWGPSCGDSWDQGEYLESLAEGLVSLAERATGQTLAKPHDKGEAPPEGFTRYQIEIDAHDDLDSSTLLEAAQEFARELYEPFEPEADELTTNDVIAPVIELIENRVSVQAMEG
jgi:hypothetical protein